MFDNIGLRLRLDMVKLRFYFIPWYSFGRIVFIPQKITLLDQSGPFLLRVFVTILY